MENKKTLTIGILTLIIGFAFGYCFASNHPTQVAVGTHIMPNGMMMSNSSDMEQMMMDMNAGLTNKTGDAFDQAFLKEMIVHHQGAVEMAKAALQSAGHQEIKDMAVNIISAQTSEIAQMKAWLKSWYNQQ
jgi:uncharacterized protein (DUF305 family)